MGYFVLVQLWVWEFCCCIMVVLFFWGLCDNVNDNCLVLFEIVCLWVECVKFFGYELYVVYVMVDEMVGIFEVVEWMLCCLVGLFVWNVCVECFVLQVIVDEMELELFFVEVYDWVFYIECVCMVCYDIDMSVLCFWFEVECVLQDGVFFVVICFYGVIFVECDDFSVYYLGVCVFEVCNEDGFVFGFYVLDFYMCDFKCGGVWMNVIVSQFCLCGSVFVVVNNFNVLQLGDGQLMLFMFDEVMMLFYEFGYVLYGFFVIVIYLYFVGINVFCDFVEFFSQVNEMWIFWFEVFDDYVWYYEIGEVFDFVIVECFCVIEIFDQGYVMSEYFVVFWLDQVWYCFFVGVDVDDVVVFEVVVFVDIGFDDFVVLMCYFFMYFVYVFFGGYSVGYYLYIWSEVFDVDMVDWFCENGGFMRVNGDWFCEWLLGVGGLKDLLEVYCDFCGCDVMIELLLRCCGLDV